MVAKSKAWIIGLALMAGLPAATAFGQAADGGQGAGQQGGGAGGGGGGRRGGGGGNFDPAQMQQRQLDRIKQTLGASDEEFTALQPKIVAVMTLERQTNAGRGGFGGGGGGGRRGGGAGGGGAAPAAATANNPVAQAIAALQETLANKDAKPDEIKAKLDAVRSAKAQSKTELTKAQEDLKSVLTQRQEAALVTMGMLE